MWLLQELQEHQGRPRDARGGADSYWLSGREHLSSRYMMLLKCVPVALDSWISHVRDVEYLYNACV